VNKPIVSRTPKQVYDLVRQREISVALLPDGELKEKIYFDLDRLRTHAETLKSVHGVAKRKSCRAERERRHRVAR